MWSYPVIQDGLIYVADLRNGLYILRYTGDHGDHVPGGQLGHALCFEPVLKPKENQENPDEYLIPEYCQA